MGSRFASYVKMFLRETRRQLDQIQEALDAGGSLQGAVTASQAVKSACGQLGANRLSSAAGLFEEQATACGKGSVAERAALRPAVERLTQLFQELEAELQRHHLADKVQLAS